MMTQTLRNKKGVTLVELLAVIVILGIIAAIAVPTIGGLIARQRANAAVATYDTVVAAAILYAEDETVFTLLSLETNDYIDLKDN
ncbi:MAG: prepilin-type N-terminal cleavage/methylation domain-containing protein, partial [Firmicutes bacterium]|nr:prepilin-type N-terminal cleavage/methylation domain-containing protein [Bacillota bacterium]